MHHCGIQTPMSSIETDYALSDPLADWEGQNLMVHSIMGDRISSTRTELVGAITAFLRPKAVYLNSDSRSMVDRAQAVLSRTWNRFRAKPWALMADGDLWETYDAICQWRHWDAHSWIGWCKGHAALDMVRRGATTQHYARKPGATIMWTILPGVHVDAKLSSSS